MCVNYAVMSCRERLELTMCDLGKYKSTKRPSCLREELMSSIYGKCGRAFREFAWTESDRYELFFGNDTACFNRNTIGKFIALQKNNRKTIVCFSSQPVNVENIPLNDCNTLYLKLGYFGAKIGLVEENSKAPESLVCVSGYKREYDDIMRRDFLNNRHLFVSDQRMKAVYEHEMMHEFDEMLSCCDHYYVLLGGMPLGYISGIRIEKDEYGIEVYLVALIWISAKISGLLRYSVRHNLLKWLRDKQGPYCAVIYMNNLPSRRLFSNLGFRPYFVRYIPW